MTLRFAILLSGRGSNMLSLAQSISTSSGKVVLVAADKSCAGIALAKDKDLPVSICHYADRPKAESEEELAQRIEDSGADFILLAGFMRVLSAEFVSRFAGRILNIHPSLLPKYKGLNTHQRALDAQDARHGVSVHCVTAGLDDGPIIAQAALDILPDDDENSLSSRLLPLEHALYGAIISALIDGDLRYDEAGYHWQKKPAIPARLGELCLPA